MKKWKSPDIKPKLYNIKKNFFESNEVLIKTQFGYKVDRYYEEYDPNIKLVIKAGWYKKDDNSEYISWKEIE